MIILESAPVFSAAGSGLSALYNVDFFASLTHQLPTEGTWQGERKVSRSLYIDNYNNSFSILITTRGGTVRCPGYSQGVVALSPGDDVMITSESAAVVSMTLYTEQKQPGFTSRGVAPITPPVAPFTVAGLISITANNQPSFMLYQPFDTMLYVVCANSRLIIKIDPLKNEVISATPISTTPICAAVGPNGLLMFGTYDGGFFTFDTVANQEIAVVFVAGAGATIVSVVWNSTQSKVYAVAQNDNLPFSFNIDGSGVSAKIGSYQMNRLRVDPNGDVFGIYNSYPYNLTKIVVGSSTTTVTSVSLGDYPQAFVKLPGGNLFLGFYGYVKLYDSNLNYLSQVTTQSGYVNQIEYASGNNRVYAGNSNGTIAAIDSALRGLVGTVPSLGNAVMSLAYCENSRKFYAGTYDGKISYINNV